MKELSKCPSHLATAEVPEEKNNKHVQVNESSSLEYVDENHVSLLDPH